VDFSFTTEQHAMLEADIPLYTRRAKNWEFDLGEARYHDDVIAAGMEM
jgi:hypothetical protein